jgi:RimJ/RimL family protein N-acetyltransferase
MDKVSSKAVDGWWADLLEVEGTGVWRPGVALSRRPTKKGSIVVVRRDDGVRVALPKWVDGALEKQLRKRSAHELLDRAFWKDIAKPMDRPVGHFIVHAYIDEPVEDAAGTERIDPADVSSWVDVVKPERWLLGGFGDHVVHAVGVRAPGGDLAAAASLSRCDEPFTTVGVLTHPAHRGRGFAARVARAATSRSVRKYGLTCYRARADDDRSRSIGKALGFTELCERLDIG